MNRNQSPEVRAAAHENLRLARWVLMSMAGRPLPQELLTANLSDFLVANNNAIEPEAYQALADVQAGREASAEGLRILARDSLVKWFSWLT